jgi:trimethylamine:corrinoid methyltransferase-like protein
LTTRHTRRWFREELFIPSGVIDRDFRRDWEAKGSLDTAARAHQRVEEMIAAYEPEPLPGEVARELEEITLRAARAAGMDALPERGD